MLSFHKSNNNFLFVFLIESTFKNIQQFTQLILFNFIYITTIYKRFFIYTQPKNASNTK